jgi:hypothetical protein
LFEAMSDDRHKTIQRHKFSPRAIEVGRFLAYGDAADTRAFLEEINRRWPDLSFRDFWGAYVLAEAVAWKPEGRA